VGIIITDSVIARAQLLLRWLREVAQLEYCKDGDSVLIKVRREMCSHESYNAKK